MRIAASGGGRFGLNGCLFGVFDGGGRREGGREERGSVVVVVAVRSTCYNH
jgi:hypothetical protein